MGNRIMMTAYKDESSERHLHLKYGDLLRLKQPRRKLSVGGQAMMSSGLGVRKKLVINAQSTSQIISAKPKIVLSLKISDIRVNRRVTY